MHENGVGEDLISLSLSIELVRGLVVT